MTTAMILHSKSLSKIQIIVKMMNPHYILNGLFIIPLSFQQHRKYVELSHHVSCLESCEILDRHKILGNMKHADQKVAQRYRSDPACFSNSKSGSIL